MDTDDTRTPGDVVLATNADMAESGEAEAGLGGDGPGPDREIPDSVEAMTEATTEFGEDGPGLNEKVPDSMEVEDED